ncbi:MULTISPECIES: helix-turn-helix domain-containing protein [Pseudomonas]|uniref:helix-turn-helix domain-containing protein n=1 Tax=Pseudomonas TaxID=286 RepID=UPI0001E9720F|nr:helix-turn-helix domain-containing protein [Pseudomonas sp. FP597]EFQ62900.1 transcriptional regulator, Cro/CI family [Pseudomonas fluorescens WH6]OPA90944.1 XRE family transcriptional regulator [Pseudomonas fluorescens]WLI09000.1 helix-turn-helix domain-containing protein [Pseudomonas sp. FP597]
MTKKTGKTTTPGADAQAVSLAVARTLKQARQAQSITLDELSRRAGVSKGMVVEIEKCTANPSIGILCKIAAALGLSVADIVNVTDVPAAHMIASQDIPTLWTGELGGTARLLAGTSGPNMIELWRWEMFPGESFSSQGHPQGTLELFHVEKGTLKCVVGETELIIPAGSSAVARTDVAHRYANAGRSRLVFTMSVTEIHQ